MLDRFEAFTFAISEITQYWNRIAASEMKRYGLKGAYAVYLEVLLRHPDGITAAKLCEICNKDKAEISRAVSVMEKKGLIERQNVAKNSYRALIILTDTGKKAAEYVRERVKIAVEAAGSGITADNRKIFYRTLNLIATNLKTISTEGLPG